MGSVEAANRFVNCVMNRTRYDTVLRSLLVIVLVLVPVLALLFGLVLLLYKDNFGNDIGRFLSAIVSVFIFYAEMLVVFFIYRRVIDHSSRDKEWRSSLIDYAESKGCDVRGMADLNDEIKRKERTVIEKPAILLIILLFVSIIIFVGCPDMFDTDTDDAWNVSVVVVIGMFDSFIMTCIVLTYLVRVPFIHESMQIEFTKEFAAEMEKIGVHIQPMDRTVKFKKLSKSVPILILVFGAVAFVLFVFTLGLFALVPMYRSFKDTNYHILNQWEYEIGLMDTIIANEGGTGVVPRKGEGVKDIG